MDSNKKLDELHLESLTRVEKLISDRSARQEEAEKARQAKEEWRLAWEKLKDVLMVLERLEI